MYFLIRKKPSKNIPVPVTFSGFNQNVNWVMNRLSPFYFKEVWYKAVFSTYLKLNVKSKHRKKGPALKFFNNETEWYIESERYFKITTDFSQETRTISIKNLQIIHSFQGEPAIEYNNGTKEWYYNGFLHRENNLPAIEYTNGDKEWFLFGKRHRQNGPAAIIGNTHYWYTHGEFIKFEEIQCTNL